MPLGLAPLSELEAVNEMLGTGAESPVSTLEDNQVIDASLAMNVLRATSVEVQTRGWSFNTEEALQLIPDIGGQIILPRNTLKVTARGCTQRGLRLYDRDRKSYKFDGPVTADLIVGLKFEDLPSTARVFITIRAARKYQTRYFGDDAQASYDAHDEAAARAALLEDEIDQNSPNMLNDSQFMRTLRSRV